MNEYVKCFFIGFFDAISVIYPSVTSAIERWTRPKPDDRTPRAFLADSVEAGLRKPQKVYRSTYPLHQRPIVLPPKDPLPDHAAHERLTLARLRYANRLVAGLVSVP
jgi:hypothetical protein